MNALTNWHLVEIVLKIPFIINERVIDYLLWIVFFSVWFSLKEPDMVFSEFTISYSDLTFSTKTLAVTYSKKFCFLGKEIKSIRNVRKWNIIAKVKAFALSFATNHNNFSWIHCSIACKSLRGAQALQCALQIYLNQYWCTPTHSIDVFCELAWWSGSQKHSDCRLFGYQISLIRQGFGS